MQQEFFDEIKSLVEKYNLLLEPKGVKCSVSRRYFEDDVVANTSLTGGFLNQIDEKLTNEKERKYLHQRNRYQCIVLTLAPIEKGIVKKADLKQFAFMLRKIERSFEGQVPSATAYSREKVLNKIERRLNKTLERADIVSPKKLCKDNFFDGLRYASGNKYKGKTVLGMDTLVFDIVLTVGVCLIAVAILFVVWLLTR